MLRAGNVFACCGCVVLSRGNGGYFLFFFVLSVHVQLHGLWGLYLATCGLHDALGAGVLLLILASRSLLLWGVDDDAFTAHRRTHGAGSLSLRSAIFLAIFFFQSRASHSTPPAALLPPAGRDLAQAKNSRMMFLSCSSEQHQSVLVAVTASLLRVCLLFLERRILGTRALVRAQLSPVGQKASTLHTECQSPKGRNVGDAP